MVVQLVGHNAQKEMSSHLLFSAKSKTGALVVDLTRRVEMNSHLLPSSKSDTGAVVVDVSVAPQRFMTFVTLKLFRN